MVTIIEKEAEKLLSLGTQLDKLATGFQFAEGPAWDRVHHRLVFSDIPANTIYQYSESDGVQVFRRPSNFSNGLCFSAHGFLLACEHQSRRVSCQLPDGTVEVLASHYNGKRLNAPNDLVVARDGSIIFTDPHYGLQDGLGGPAEEEQPCRGVYRVVPGADEPVLLVSDFDGPNGLALTADESTLYVVDSIHQHIRAFHVEADWSLTGGEILVELKGEEGEEGVPDGLKLDADGNIYSTGPGGIWICNPGGALVARIAVPEVAANLGWGDSDNRSLYITASTSLYKLRCWAQGPDGD